MTSLDWRSRALAIALTALAGYVDAIGFIRLGGFFVSFMSGNTTRLAVGVARGGTEAATAAGLIALFVTGVVLGSTAGRKAGRWRRPVVLTIVGLLLAASPILEFAGAGRWAVASMTLAMGAENAVFEDGGEIRVGLTYMTGTLVKAGQRLAVAITGGEKWGWVPYLSQWFGLALGALAGALAYPVLGLNGLWISAAGMMLAAILSAL
jgi:uncharacterized membrane protein YoaK (UPF0700 family)